jgi:Reverse transcriptase (RNA-dependent DNA polymerase)
LSADFWLGKNRLTDSQVISLAQTFKLVEVKRIVFSYNSNKSPGSDEFSFQFYQSYWNIVADDVTPFVNAFYLHKLDLRRINLASIILIPKKNDDVTITQFRPISLINCRMKILTKLLTERLSPLMNDLISLTQTTYIKGRYIMDNVVCAHETLHSIHRKKLRCVLFKLDFEKAFDRVN